MMEQNSSRLHILKSSSNNFDNIRSPRRSPMTKNSMPKSPVPDSPIAYERFKSKCTYGLISFFGFNQKHSEKLISNKKRHSVGEEYRDRLGLLPQIDENCQCSHDTKKRIAAAKVNRTKSYLDPVAEPRNHGKSTKSSRRRPSRFGCYNVDTLTQREPGPRNLLERSSDKLDTTVTSQAPFGQVPLDKRRNDQDNEINLRVHIDEATEAFINQKFVDGKHLGEDRENYRSKQFLDALEILNSNKDLFIKLLQDPNSLLVKHIENLRDIQSAKKQIDSSTGAKLTIEHQASKTMENEECVSFENKNVGDRNLFKRNINSQAEEEIVILRPRLRTQETEPVKDSLKNVRQSVKPTFSPLKRMKRTLKHVMTVSKREQEPKLSIPAVENNTNEFLRRHKWGEEAVMDSVDKNSLLCGEMSVPSYGDNDKDLTNKATIFAELAGAASSPSTISHAKGDNHQLLSKRRTRIPELSEKSMNIFRNRRPASWDGLSYDLFHISSRKKGEPGNITPQMRLSLYSSCQLVKENKLKKMVKDENFCLSPVRCDVEAIATVDEMGNKSQFWTEANTSDTGESKSKDIHSSSPEVLSELNGLCSQGDNQGRITSSARSNACLSISSPASPSSLRDSSCSHSSIRGVVDFVTTKEGAEQPSPVSVLEPFLCEDTTSPFSTRSLSAEKVVMPIQVGSEEQNSEPKIQFDTSVKELGSMFEYIMEVLQASCLDWDDLSFKWHSADQILDKSLFDKLDLWPNQSSINFRLHFDYVNEVLEELYWKCLRCSPWLSFIKPEVHPITVADSLIDEAIKSIDLSLILQTSLPTLGQTVEKDLAKSTRWMDIRIDAYETLSDLTETILQELITTEFAIG